LIKEKETIFIAKVTGETNVEQAAELLAELLLDDCLKWLQNRRGKALLVPQLRTH